MPDHQSSELQKDNWEVDYEVKTVCPECKVYPANIVDEFSSGDSVCSDCGLVLGSRIVDTRSEWRTFANDDHKGADPNRVGEALNPLFNGSQLVTMIASQSGIKGTALERAHHRAQDHRINRTLVGAYAEISAFCEVIQTTALVSTTAKTLFKLVDDNRALRGKPQSVIIAGCIFIACRQCSVPRTFAEIFALTRIPKKEIGRIFKLLEKFFISQGVAKGERDRDGNVKTNDNNNDQENNNPARSNAYALTTATAAHALMIRFCNHLNLGVKATTVAEEIAKRVADGDILSGRSTLTCSGSIIYLVSHIMGDQRTIQQIAQVVGVSKSTIKFAYKKLYQTRELIFESDWVLRHGGDPMLMPVVK